MNGKIYKKLIVFLALVIFQGSIAHAQKMAIKLGDSNFRDFNYMMAIDYYEYAFKKDSTDAYVIRRLAESNNNIGETVKAENWLRILIRQEKATPDDLYMFAQILKNNGKYPEAEKVMRNYAELRPDDKRTLLEVSMLEYIRFLMRDSSKYVIMNVSTNTEGSDMGPAFYKDGLVFSSTSLDKLFAKRTYGWNDLPYLHMYIAQIASNGDLAFPTPFAPKLKTSLHDGPMCYDEKNNRIFYTVDNFSLWNSKKSRKGVINLKINFAKDGENGWEYDGSLKFNSSEYSVGHPSIDTTGNVLYFASDMPGGYGGSDIYSTTYSDGRWGAPVNLGPKVNSGDNEFFPFISNDGVLYFASNGHGGMGGLDIFFSVPENEVFNSIENMGYPVNSSRDDFALVLDKTCVKGYFTSNRLKGKGNDDIYSLKINRVPVILQGIVRDTTTLEALANAKILLIRNKTGDTISTSFSRANGAFEFELNKGQTYTVIAERESYSTDKKNIRTNGLHPSQEINIEMYLRQKQQQLIAQEDTAAYPEPLEIEEENGEPLEVFELEYINYDLDKWDIRKDAAEILDRLAGIMIEHPDMEIRLESHTDSRGSDEYNLILSKKRAKSAFDYLVDRGIDPSRMQYEGYGETRLLNKCANGVPCTEAEHAVNRRTIVKVVRKGQKSKRGQRGIFYF